MTTIIQCSHAVLKVYIEVLNLKIGFQDLEKVWKTSSIRAEFH